MPSLLINYKMLISFPSDVPSIYIDIIKKNCLDWTVHNYPRGYSLKAQEWKNDSVPTFGQHPQDILNTQLVNNCDLLVAIFWCTRGTKTLHNESGTEEEIKLALSRGIPVMVYFYKGNEDPFLDELKNKYSPLGLYHVYSDSDYFEGIFRKHLSEKMHNIIEGKEGNLIPALINFFNRINPKIIPSILSGSQKFPLHLGEQNIKLLKEFAKHTDFFKYIEYTSNGNTYAQYSGPRNTMLHDDSADLNGFNFTVTKDFIIRLEEYIPIAESL